MIELPLTPAQFKAAAAKLKAEAGIAIAIAGAGGQIAHSGCTVSWQYDGATLVLRVLSKPMLVSLPYVEQRIREWFTAA